MKKMMAYVCCCVICLLPVTGCISIEGGHSANVDKQVKNDNTNLCARIDVEKNGASICYCSSIVSRNTITISHAFQEKDNSGTIILAFTGNDIKQLSENSYSMNYKIGLKVPMAVSSGKDSRSFQYTEEGSSSTMNIKLGQPVYIYENTMFKVKLTLDMMK